MSRSFRIYGVLHEGWSTGFGDNARVEASLDADLYDATVHRKKVQPTEIPLWLTPTKDRLFGLRAPETGDHGEILVRIQQVLIVNEPDALSKLSISLLIRKPYVDPFMAVYHNQPLTSVLVGRVSHDVTIYEVET